MKKAELQKQLARLKDMESRMCTSRGDANGYYDTARLLRKIRTEELFKCVRKDGRMVYRTFNSYIAHFGITGQQKSLLIKLMDLDKLLDKYSVPEIARKFPSFSLEFWSKFFRVSADRQVELVCMLYDDNKAKDHYSVTDLNKILKEHKDLVAKRKSIPPSALAVVLGNVPKITTSEFESVDKNSPHCGTEEERLALCSSLMDLVNVINDVNGNALECCFVDTPVEDHTKVYDIVRRRSLWYELVRNHKKKAYSNADIIRIALSSLIGGVCISILAFFFVRCVM